MEQLIIGDQKTNYLPKIQYDRTIKMNSLCIALLLSLQMLNHYIGLNTVVVGGLILIVTILSNKKISINKKGLMLYLFVIFWFVISWLVHDVGQTTLYYFVFFSIYCGCALYLSDKRYDIQKIIFYLSWIHVIVSPIILASAIKNGSTMGDTYSILAGVFSLVYMIFTKTFRVSSIHTIVFTCTLLIFVYKISLVNTRGVYLSILVFLTLLIIVSSFKKKKTIVIIYSISLLSFYFVYQNLYEIMLLISNILSEFNINLSAINKSIHLLETDRFDHNRDWFTTYALSGIEDNIWFGQGIGSFEYQTGRVYIHNVILQILFEGGIIYFIPFLIPLLKLFQWMLPVQDSQKKIQLFIILLFSSSFIKLLFSETYIKEQKFLLLIMLLFILKKQKDKQSEAKP